MQSRMHAILIPNSSAWFTKVFGPTSGPALDFQYRYQLGYQFQRLYTYLPIYGDGQKLVHTEHCEPGHLSRFVADSELIPLAEQSLKIYSAVIATNETGPWLKVGSFVYVDGDFRYLGSLAIAPNWHSFFCGYPQMLSSCRVASRQSGRAWRKPSAITTSRRPGRIRTKRAQNVKSCFASTIDTGSSAGFTIRFRTCSKCRLDSAERKPHRIWANLQRPCNKSRTGRQLETRNLN